VGAEDGNVAIKIGQQNQGEAQVIGHPGCVTQQWNMVELVVELALW